LYQYRATLIERDGAEWYMETAGMVYRGKVEGRVTVVGGAKLAAAHQDQRLVIKTGPAYTWAGSSEGAG
jgi:hypothetical protein